MSELINKEIESIPALTLSVIRGSEQTQTKAADIYTMSIQSTAL